MRRFSALLSLLLLSAPAAAQGSVDDAQLRSVILQATTEVIRPGYGQFSDAADAMLAAIRTHCQAPSAQSLEQSRAAFFDLATKWARVEFIRFGPAMEENRLERVLFWPDRRGLGLRQTQRILAQEDATAVAPDGLAQKSVAVQGLTALEFLLFRTGHEELMKTDGYRCNYARAIAANIDNIANEIATAWQTGDPLTMIGADDATPVERLNLMIGALVHGLENVRDIRLGAFLGGNPEDDRPKLALFWRSANTFPVMAASLGGLHDLFARSDMSSLLPGDATSIGDSIDFEFNELEAVLDGLDGPPAQALPVPEKRRQLVLLDIILDSLIERIDERYAPAVGLSAGFSFADGD